MSDLVRPQLRQTHSREISALAGPQLARVPLEEALDEGVAAVERVVEYEPLFEGHDALFQLKRPTDFVGRPTRDPVGPEQRFGRVALARELVTAGEAG